MAESDRYDVVIIGAGFAGMYMLMKVRELGLSVRVLERADDVGGTWYWNRYPGARCDCESMYYSYSFSPELEQEWHWTERYPAQPEILSYLQHVADRFDLRKDIDFSTSVAGASFDEPSAHWVIDVDGGRTVEARFLVAAVGCLSVPSRPDLPGGDSFLGEIYHTGEWPHHEVTFRDKRVGVIGTGASGIQSIPVIAEEAARLTVFQRTPNFTIPARNTPMDPDFERRWKAHYRAWRRRGRDSAAGIPYSTIERAALEHDEDQRREIYEAAWVQGGLSFGGRTFSDIRNDLEANETVVRFIHSKIDEIVHDPSVADMLKPRDYPFGTKRLPLDTDYYETFNRPNVSLVDLRRTPIEEITPTGIRTTDASYELDMIVYATGFDAMTGPLLALGLRGRDGVTLGDVWPAGPHTYLGLAVHGFPNLFTVTGPGSPSVLSNMPVSIEQHVEWIAECIGWLVAEGLDSIEADFEAQEAWTAHGNELASHTLYPRAASWYMGANIPGKPRVFMPYLGGLPAYRQKCDEVAVNGYEGFILGRVADRLATAR